ncbi:hypothetical protein ACGK9R_10085 [Halomonas sp. HNIBRBA4712]|uniref:hypothetical protein n=1 Tax=Halomonas sp. HNIBRBA4712 TaxID=3373087 RepID=UPI0037471804
MRINLLLAALALALWAFGAPWLAATALWVGAIWLFITAALLDFTLRYSRHVLWQLTTSALLLGLIAAAPERHNTLIWVWAAFFMLPQSRRVLACNALGALASWALIAITTPFAQALMLLLALGIVSLLAYIQSRRLINVNGAIRQRLRLIPGLNLWAGEQLVRDLSREQIRARRESIHAEVVIVHVKRQKLWSCAQELCALTHDFESVYRLDGSRLAVLLLCRDSEGATKRRQEIESALYGSIQCQHVPLCELAPDALSLESLAERFGLPGYSV